MKKIFLLVGLFAIASFFIDKPVFSFMQSIQNRYLSSLLVWFSYLWTIFFVLLVITSLFMLEEKKARWLKVLWLSFFSSLLLSTMLKLIFQTPRPLGTVWGIGFMPYSFPSAHAAVAFSLIPVLDREFGKLKWFWVCFAVLVCISRIYIGAHYLSDVVWGAVIGYAVGNLFLWLEKNRKLEWLSWTKKTHSR